MRKASVKLVESSVRIVVGVLENLVIATRRYGSKIQDPKCRRSPRSLIESSQESEGSVGQNFKFIDTIVNPDKRSRFHL
jgi:hypothetical protein